MNTIQLYCFNNAQRLDEEVFQKCLGTLPASIQLEIKAYKHWESAQASLLGKMLLSYALKEKNLAFGIHQLEFTEKDRPFINEDIDFNISHSGEYVVLAISASASVGVDIEKHRELDYLLFRKYFSNPEWSMIEAAEDKTTAFFNLWAIKESAIKCDGRGVEVLSKTHVEDYRTELSNRIYCDGRLFFFMPLDIKEQYSACVCSNQNFQLDLHHLTIQEVLAGK